MAVILIADGSLAMVSKSLDKRLKELEIRGSTTDFLRLVRMLRRVLETWEDLLSDRLQWKTTCKCWCKKLSKSLVIITDKIRLHLTCLETLYANDYSVKIKSNIWSVIHKKDYILILNLNVKTVWHNGHITWSHYEVMKNSIVIITHSIFIC